jgi:Zn-dependent M32 family carboxypeptidase
LTKCRTLIEEVLIFSLETKKQTAKNKGDYNKLYQQFKEIFNMKQLNEVDKRINNLLSGLEKIISSICDLRNINSDSHGAGKKRIKINEKEARLVVNSTVVFCTYVFDICLNSTYSK